ncbi:MAG: hypothetical protein KGI26_04875 [Thaumarchaeota archaeon]|nr:hypothetical protein [Nitrososphaerota archaeon]
MESPKQVWKDDDPRYGLIDAYVDAQAWQPTTSVPRRLWLKSWARLLGKPLEDATTQDMILLRDEFASHRGWVPGKYAGALALFYDWVGKVREGFKDPMAPVKFPAGKRPPWKNALPREQMDRVLQAAWRGDKAAGIVGAVRPANYGGPDAVKEGRAVYSQNELLWYWDLRIAPVFLFRVHELLPYRAPHRVKFVIPEEYEVECREPGCGWRGRYAVAQDGFLRAKVLAAGKEHVESEKLAQFQFMSLEDDKGKKYEGATFRRKGRVSKNRDTGEWTSSEHWAEPKPFDRETMHHLKMLLIAPPKTCRAATKTLHEWGAALGIRLTNEAGEEIGISSHIWGKHSSVTDRLPTEGDDFVARDADVNVGSLVPYRHHMGRPKEVSRLVKAGKFWKEED